MSTTEKNNSSTVAQAGKVSAATGFSRILGLVREQVMAGFFGASMVTDAFIAAYRIPNLLRDMFAEGALSSAFVPVFKEKLVNEGKEEAISLAERVLGVLLLVVGSVVILGIIAAPALVYISANGFTENIEKFNLTVSLTRLMFAYLLLVSLSAMVMGILNSFGRFGIPALSPAMFNIGVVLTVVGLYRFFDQPIYSLAIGVLVGGIAQTAVQLPSLWKLGCLLKPKLAFLDEGVKRIFRLMLPMIVGMSAGRVNILLSTLLASFLIEGTISYLNYAYRLMHFPLGVFAVALGTVALPKASEMAARRDTEGLSNSFVETLNLNLLLVVPSAVFLAVMGKDLVGLIFQWGQFTAADAANTSRVLWHYSYGLIGFAAVRVIVPYYYACNDSKLPMKVSIAAVVVNMALYYPLIKLLDFAGLAAATSIGGLVNFALLVVWLPRDSFKIPYAKLALNSFRILVAALSAFYIALLVPIPATPDLPVPVVRSIELFLPLVVAGGVYLLLCLIFRVSEVSHLLGKLRRRK